MTNLCNYSDIFSRFTANHINYVFAPTKIRRYNHTKKFCIKLLDRVTEELDDGGSVDVIYLDFAKAFDKVPHQRLLRKLEGYGVSGRLLAWIRGWLLNRTAESGGEGILVGMEKSAEWNSAGFCVGAGAVLGVH